MPSSTKGRRVRVPFESRCSVRQYAYQDIRGLSKAGQRHTCLPRFLRQRVIRTQEERAVLRLDRTLKAASSLILRLGNQKMQQFRGTRHRRRFISSSRASAGGKRETAPK